MNSRPGAAKMKPQRPANIRLPHPAWATLRVLQYLKQLPHEPPDREGQAVLAASQFSWARIIRMGFWPVKAIVPGRCTLWFGSDISPNLSRDMEIVLASTSLIVVT